MDHLCPIRLSSEAIGRGCKVFGVELRIVSDMEVALGTSGLSRKGKSISNPLWQCSAPRCDNTKRLDTLNRSERIIMIIINQTIKKKHIKKAIRIHK